MLSLFVNSSTQCQRHPISRKYVNTFCHSSTPWDEVIPRVINNKLIILLKWFIKRHKVVTPGALAGCDEVRHVRYSQTLNGKVSFQLPRFEGRQRVAIGEWWRMTVVPDMSWASEGTRAQSWWMVRWACSRVSGEDNVRVDSQGLMWQLRYSGEAVLCIL